MSKKPTKGRKVRPPKTVSPAPTLTNQEASADQLVAQGGDPSLPSLAYSSALPDWSLVRDVMTGARAVRGAREKYLPRITDETNEDYNRRVEFAPFVNNFRDSIETIVSKPFSKDVALQGDVSSKFKEIAADIDGQGTGLHKFARDLFKEGVAQGVAGILVDYPAITAGATLADERRLGARPYWVSFRAEDIIALYTKFDHGRRYVSHVRLREDTVKRVGFSEIPVRRVRVLNDDGMA